MELIKRKDLSSLDFDSSYFGKWITELNNFEQLYQNASPFSYVVIDDFLKEDVAQSLLENFQKPNEKWWHYSNTIEEK